MKWSLYFPVIIRFLKNLPPFEVMFNLIKFQINKIQKNSRVNFEPISLVISATKRCNFTCEFCFVEDYMGESKGTSGDLEEDDFFKIINSTAGKKALRIGFLGGEPFLNKNIFSYLKELHKRKKITTVVTNSSLIKGKILDQLLNSSLDVLGLSLYDNNLQDVERVSTACNGKINYWIQTVVDSNNLRKIENTILFALKVGCKQLILDNYYPKTEDRIEKTIFDDNEEYKILKKELSRKYKGKISITWVPMVVRALTKPKNCQLPMSYVQLDNKGNIGPCCVRAPDVSFGNIYTTESWNSDKIIQLRESMYDKKIEPHDICKYCQCLSEDLYNV